MGSVRRRRDTYVALVPGQAPGALQARLAAPASLPDSPPVALPAAPPALVLAIPAEVLRQRPDVQAAERRLGAWLAPGIVALSLIPIPDPTRPD